MDYFAIGIVFLCGAMILASVYVVCFIYCKWQRARTANTKLVITMMEERKKLINKAIESHCYQCYDFPRCETHHECKQCNAMRKYMEEQK